VGIGTVFPRGQLEVDGANFGVYGVATGSSAIAGSYGVLGSASGTGKKASYTVCNGGCGATIVPRAGVWADTNHDGDAGWTYYPALLATADANIAAFFVKRFKYRSRSLGQQPGLRRGLGRHRYLCPGQQRLLLLQRGRRYLLHRRPEVLRRRQHQRRRRPGGNLRHAVAGELV